MSTLFISDIHLNGAQPAITSQFVAFLRGAARQAQHLYILGDLFEFWIGDDNTDPAYAQIQDELLDLTRSGVSCSVMHGNRDFLLGKQFCTRTGCQLLDDGTVIELYGQRVLLTHGDLLCTDDHAYQRLRRIVRNPGVQWLFKHLSVAQRERIAIRIRKSSRMRTKTAASNIMDVNQQAVARAFTQHQVRLMVHGHTHRPAVHRHASNASDNTRIVLGDWYTQGSVLRWSSSGYELLSLSRSAEHPSENGTEYPAR